MKAKKVTAKTKDTCMCCDSALWSCCTDTFGAIHVVSGLGIGFLLVQYLHLGNLLVWGWLLVGVGVLGHLVGKMKCDHCA